ncbi:MAG: hypothetical protein B7Z55_11205 [Planctomycetales bacterium 12-60-4]|nr:MAG: hypothetical protein B7Z55_11205 [Planctomycetales bacterium 12-60-4]
MWPERHHGVSRGDESRRLAPTRLKLTMRTIASTENLAFNAIPSTNREVWIGNRLNCASASPL